MLDIVSIQLFMKFLFHKQQQQSKTTIKRISYLFSLPKNCFQKIEVILFLFSDVYFINYKQTKKNNNKKNSYINIKNNTS